MFFILVREIPFLPYGWKNRLNIFLGLGLALDKTHSREYSQVQDNFVCGVISVSMIISVDKSSCELGGNMQLDFLYCMLNHGVYYNIWLTRVGIVWKLGPSLSCTVSRLKYFCSKSDIPAEANRNKISYNIFPNDKL